jgi:pyruvate/2-oxoglutarate dehydrogenase complex dihydrolipoamide dehydrogenase (E3) component
VGWTEEEAVSAGLPITAHSATFTAVTEDEKRVIDPVPAMLKILLDPESRRILGVHAIGHYAANVVNTAALTISSGMTIEDLSNVTFVHPSAAETIQECSSKFAFTL